MTTIPLPGFGSVSKDISLFDATVNEHGIRQSTTERNALPPGLPTRPHVSLMKLARTVMQSTRDFEGRMSFTSPLQTGY